MIIWKVGKEEGECTECARRSLLAVDLKAAGRPFFTINVRWESAEDTAGEPELRSQGDGGASDEGEEGMSDSGNVCEASNDGVR